MFVRERLVLSSVCFDVQIKNSQLTYKLRFGLQQEYLPYSSRVLILPQSPQQIYRRLVPLSEPAFGEGQNEAVDKESSQAFNADFCRVADSMTDPYLAANRRGSSPGHCGGVLAGALVRVIGHSPVILYCRTSHREPSGLCSHSHRSKCPFFLDFAGVLLCAWKLVTQTLCHFGKIHLLWIEIMRLPLFYAIPQYLLQRSYSMRGVLTYS